MYYRWNDLSRKYSSVVKVAKAFVMFRILGRNAILRRLSLLRRKGLQVLFVENLVRTVQSYSITRAD